MRSLDGLHKTILVYFYHSKDLFLSIMIYNTLDGIVVSCIHHMNTTLIIIKLTSPPTWFQISYVLWTSSPFLLLCPFIFPLTTYENNYFVPISFFLTDFFQHDAL